MPRVAKKAKGEQVDLGPLFQLKDLPGIPHPTKPLLICVLDGWGESKYHDKYNAAYVAPTPTMDALRESAPRHYRLVKAHGPYVGLPSNGDMGNSEVGHNALGSGQIVDQGAKCVDKALDSGAIWDYSGWETIAPAATSHTLHLIGLLSDGGVHSRYDQLQKLVEGALQHGVKRIRLHVLHDGRDCQDDTAVSWLERLTGDCKKWEGEFPGSSVLIASGGGRMKVTMDRYDSDWDVVKRGYYAHVLGEAPDTFVDPVAGVAELKKRLGWNGKPVSDQQVDPWVVVDAEGKPVGPVEDGDAVVIFNFRADRVIELSKAIEYDDFTAFDRKRHPKVAFAGMMQYDGELKLPAVYLVPPPSIERASEQYLIASGISVFACSESQKIGHVTFFWNGNRSGYLDPKLEKFDEIHSDTGISFDAKPAMKSHEIARDVIKAIKSGTYKVVRCNFPNPDMVGHTGNLEATIEACKDTDEALGQILKAIEEVGGIYLVTADHGNCEDMVKRDKKTGEPVLSADGTPEPLTSHTLNPVGVAIGGPGLPKNVSLEADVKDPGLANVTATFINLLGYQAPDFYEPSLIKIDDAKTE